MSKKVTVVVPVWEPGDYLWDCLDSIRKQTLSPDLYEVLIILNGKKEPYYQSIADYRQNHSIENLTLIHTPIGRVSLARNMGLDKACGEYVLFVDDDDYLANDYLESMLARAEEGAIVMSNNRVFEDGSERELGNLISANYRADYETGNILEFRKFYRIVWMKLIPMEMIGKTRFDAYLQPGEDTLFMMEILARTQKIKTIQEGCFYHRRIRTSSMMFRDRALSIFWKESLYNLARHAQLLVRRSCLRHKTIVVRSMLGITRHLIKHSIYTLYRRTRMGEHGSCASGA